jgi:hypothetical protein
MHHSISAHGHQMAYARLLLTGLLSLISTLIFTQKTIAVIHFQPGEEFPVTTRFLDTLHYLIKMDSATHHLTYDLRDSALHFLPEKSFKAEEKAADYLMFYNVSLYENYRPPVNVDKVEGRITGVNFRLSTRVNVACKIIDLATNTVIYSNINHVRDGISMFAKIDFTERDGVFPIPNWQDLFGLNVATMEKNEPEKYKAILDKLHKDYRSRFQRFFEAKKETMINSFLSCERKFQAPDLMPCGEVLIENEKVKKIWLETSSLVVLPEHELIRILSLDTVNGFVVSDLHGFYFIEDIENGKARLDAGIYAKLKEAAEAHLSGKQLYASFLDGGYFEKLNDPREPYTIGLNSGAAINYFETALMSIDNLILVDIGATWIVDLFREQYKKERFIDDDFSAKNRGVKYLLDSRDGQYQIIDVASGTLVRAYEADKGFEGFIDQAMDIFNQEIELVEILNGDEKKVKKLRLYSPFGFNGIEYYKIYELTTEKVNGKDVIRPVPIGQCQGRIVFPSRIEDFVVTKGEEELRDALNRGAPIRFRQKVFHFLGKTYY